MTEKTRADVALVNRGLAESREVSEDGCTYTYHLREGLKWSDGTPLTAEDFVYGFQRLADPTTGSGSVYYITDCCEVKNADEINRLHFSILKQLVML